MGGETEKSVSGWTVDTLKEHIDRQLAGMDQRLKEAILNAKESGLQASKSAQLAIDKAEVATSAKFASVNEFRATLSDQSDRMMPRVESEQRHQANLEKLDAVRGEGVLARDALSARIDELNRRMLLREGAESGSDKTKGVTIATIAIIIAAVGALSGVLGSVLATIFRPGVH